MASLTLTEDRIHDLADRGYSDPVFWCTVFLSHLFGGESPGDGKGGPMPWFHRGALAILCRTTDFLWNYGQVAKIQTEFVITRPNVLEEDKKTEKVLGHIFHIHERATGRELTPEEISACEKQLTPEELKRDLEIVMHLGRYTMMMWPRGYSKTTIAGIAVPLYKICYRLRPLFCYISETGTHAEMQANNIRSELTSNELIKTVFGNLAPGRSDNEKWSERFFETKTGIAMATRGRGAQIRGLNHKGNRPSEEIWDDVENKESVKTDTQRKKTLDWAVGDALPALPKLDKTATVTVLGTLLHPECMMRKLAVLPEWTTIRFSVVDRAGEPLWPAQMTTQEIEMEKKSYEQLGMLSTFYLEYYNQYRADNTARFTREMFVFEPTPHEDIIAWVIYCDPAIGERRANDTCVISVAGVTAKGKRHIAAEWRAKGIPDLANRAVDAYFQLAKLFRPIDHGFEANAYQRAFGTLLQNAMAVHNYYFVPNPIQSVTAKSERIMGLLHPLVASQWCTFANALENSDSITECVDYDPEIKDQPDDGPDCFAGCLKLLEPFSPYASASDDYDNEEEEYEDLDKLFGEDWRSAP